MSNILNFTAKKSLESPELAPVLNSILRNDRYSFWTERKKLLGHPYADAIFDALDLMQKEIIALSVVLTLDELPLDCFGAIDHSEPYPTIYIFLVVEDVTVVFQCFNLDGEITHENYVAQKTKYVGKDAVIPAGWKGLFLNWFDYLAKLHQGGFGLRESDGAYGYDVLEPKDGYISFMSVSIKDSTKKEVDTND